MQILDLVVGILNWLVVAFEHRVVYDSKHLTLLVHNFHLLGWLRAFVLCLVKHLGQVLRYLVQAVVDDISLLDLHDVQLRQELALFGACNLLVLLTFLLCLLRPNTLEWRAETPALLLPVGLEVIKELLVALSISSLASLPDWAPQLVRIRWVYL